jgi:hypothetical protein
MSVATRDGEHGAELAAATQPKAAPSAFFRRFRPLRDMAFVLSAWAASWAFVILVVKGLSGLL